MAKKNASGTGDSNKKNSGANIGYEAELWQMADALRGSMRIINLLPFVAPSIEQNDGSG